MFDESRDDGRAVGGGETVECHERVHVVDTRRFVAECRDVVDECGCVRAELEGQWVCVCG